MDNIRDTRAGIMCQLPCPAASPPEVIIKPCSKRSQKPRFLFLNLDAGQTQEWCKAEHETEIAAYKAAKKYFDELGLEKLPTIKTLQAEYASLSAENKALYQGYRQARDYMQKILTARQNVEQLLNCKDTDHETKNKSLRIKSQGRNEKTVSR